MTGEGAPFKLRLGGIVLRYGCKQAGLAVSNRRDVACTGFKTPAQAKLGRGTQLGCIERTGITWLRSELGIRLLLHKSLQLAAFHSAC